VSNRAGALAALNPKAVVDRGYAIVRNRSGKVIRDPGQVSPAEALDLELAGGEVQVRVETGT
jgi:exodeoxyribonuclease VII large subunit